MPQDKNAFQGAAQGRHVGGQAIAICLARHVRSSACQAVDAGDRQRVALAHEGEQRIQLLGPSSSERLL